ncbi:helix-turn-helix domain-containing protein [Streptomyces sp. NPDC006512]|uniref:helix-turn-helix domain-containing protein n=1 Tax=Streptomyces sp. NPDC006512 TaxID=3154307 RepID=UPI0033A62F02
MTQGVDTTSGSELGLPSPKERRRLREAGELTHEEVAEALGVTAATVRSWESGRTEPRGRKREVYAEILARLAAVDAVLAADPPDARRAATAPPHPPEPPTPPGRAPAAPFAGWAPRSTGGARASAAGGQGRPAGSGTRPKAAAKRAAKPPAGAARHETKAPVRTGGGSSAGGPPPSPPPSAPPPAARPTTPPADSTGPADAPGPAAPAGAPPSTPAHPGSGSQASGPRAPEPHTTDAPAPEARTRAHPTPDAPAPEAAAPDTAEPDAPEPDIPAPEAEAPEAGAPEAGAPEPHPLEPHPLEPQPPEARAAEADRSGVLGPVQAFDSLYAYAAPAFIRQAYLLTARRALAHEAVERAFQQAWDRWPEVAVDPDPVGWVRAAVYEYALSPWHRFRRAHRHPDKPPAEPADRIVLDALLALPPVHRRTVLLYDGVGLDLPDTAAETEASTPTTGNRLLNAHAELSGRIPEMAGLPPEEQSALLRERLGAVVPSVRLEPRPAAVVRAAGENRGRRWTRAGLVMTALIAVATAYTTATAPREYEPPASPARSVTGVPPHSGPQRLTEQSRELQDKLRADPAAGPARVSPSTE